jgi:hypothetical protein
VNSLWQPPCREQSSGPGRRNSPKPGGFGGHGTA